MVVVIEWREPSDDIVQFDPDWIPLAMRDYLEAVAMQYQVPLEYVFFVALGVLAAVTQGKVTVQVKENHSEWLSLYLAPVLESGNRKSAVINELTKPLKEYELERRKLEKSELVRIAFAYERQQEIVKASKNPKTKKSQNEIDAEIELLANMEKPRDPFRLTISDITPEKLTELLCKHKSLSMVESEGGFLENLAGKYSDKTASVGTVNKSWSGEALIFDRRQGDSLDTQYSHFVWVAAAQPVTLYELQRNSTFLATGLSNRFLYSVPVSLMGRRISNAPPIPGHLQITWAKIVESIARSCESDRTLAVGNECRSIIETFNTEIEPRLGEGCDLREIAGWVSKLAGNLIRVAALYTLATNPRATELEPDLLQASLEMNNYLISHAQRVLQPTTSGELGEIVEKALAISKPLSDLPEELQQGFVSFVSEACLVFQFRELLRKFDNQTAKALRGKLTALQRAGYLRSLPNTSTGGRPPEYWAINPHFTLGSGD